MKILYFGHEVGNQMALYAQEARSQGHEAISVNIGKDTRFFSNEYNFQQKGIFLDFRRLWFAFYAVFHFDVFHFFYGVSLVSIWRFHHLDLWLLKLLGKKVVVHFRGSELVNPEHYQHLSGEKKFEKEPDHLAAKRKKWAQAWEKYADVILVSTPDLLGVSPRAQWMPQVIDVSEWPFVHRDFSTTLAIHAPTRRYLKGTRFFEDAAQQIQIPLEMIEGNATPMQALNRGNLGFDQLIIGWYGKVAVEMMAMGIPVVVHIQSDYLPATIREVPVISANATNLTERLVDYLSWPTEKKKALAEEARTFVETHHNIHQQMDRLMTWYRKD
jgi:glycosyltransferase involved in cell wall biosynthesis